VTANWRNKFYFFWNCNFRGPISGNNRKGLVDFTFSGPCIMIHIRENNQRDAHFFSLIYSN